MKTSTSHWGSFHTKVRDGRLVDTVPFQHDPNPSRLTDMVPEAVHSPLRINKPAIREGWLKKRSASKAERGNDRFVEVDWDVALDFVSEELSRIRSEYGAHAIFGGSYGWSSAGRLHHARTLLHRMLYMGGGCVGQVTNYSYAAGMVLLPHIVGNADPVAGRMTDWRSIVENSRLMVFFGGINRRNFQVSSGGFGEHSTENWLKDARAAGVEFVAIGPDRKDAATDLGSQWLPIRPNTDTALMLALSTTLIEEGLHDRDFLDRCCSGFDEFQDYLLGIKDGQRKDADWAAKITGIDADIIRNLARRMAATRTMLTASWSLQRADHGEQPYWALIALASILGQIGLPGGGFGFGYGSINGRGTPRRPIASPVMQSGRNPIDFNIPVARIADLLLEPGRTIDFNGSQLTYPDIRLVYWAGGNPFHHHQDLARLTQAIRQPETFIVNEIWWTSTARHADIVLPATTSLERDDIGASPADRYILAMPQVIAPVGQARNDFDIFCDICERLGYRAAFDENRSQMEWLHHIYRVFREGALEKGVVAPDFENFWQAGWYEIPPPDAGWSAFQDFTSDPQAYPLKTSSGKIELVSSRIASYNYPDCGAHPKWIPPREWLGSPKAADYPLHLISNQPETRLHSQLDNTRWSAQSKISGREVIRIHPHDAHARGLTDGDVVEVFNDRGSCLAAVRISDDLLPGVVQLPTGAWFDPAEKNERILECHGNPNILTPDHGTSRLGQGPSPMSTLVDIRPYQGEIPPISVLTPPSFVPSQDGQKYPK